MWKTKQQALFEKYQINIFDDIKYVYIMPGWFNLAEKTFQKLIEAGWDRNISGIKQKFASLQIHVEISDSVPLEQFKLFYQIIDAAKEESYSICEVCGNEGKPIGNYWATRCNEHKKFGWEEIEEYCNKS